MAEPKVSILIPVYNREYLVRHAIESALDQTYRNIEVVVTDNHSNDRTWGVVMTYARQDPRLKCYRNRKNIGAIRNFIKGLQKCNGEYVKVLFSDDWIEPTFVEETLKVITAHEDVGLVFTSTIRHQPERDLACYHHPNQVVFSTREYLKKTILMDHMPVSPGCSLVRRKDACFPFPIGSNQTLNAIAEQFGAGPDVLFLLEVAIKYPKVAHIPKFLSHFLAHENITRKHFPEVMKAYRLAFEYFLSQLSSDDFSGLKYEIVEEWKQREARPKGCIFLRKLGVRIARLFLGR